MPYATSTPNANEANTAQTSIKELIPSLLTLTFRVEPDPVPPPN
jgi:hypothetical protein